MQKPHMNTWRPMYPISEFVLSNIFREFLSNLENYGFRRSICRGYKIEK